MALGRWAVGAIVAAVFAWTVREAIIQGAFQSVEPLNNVNVNVVGGVQAEDVQVVGNKLYMTSDDRRAWLKPVSPEELTRSIELAPNGGLYIATIPAPTGDKLSLQPPKKIAIRNYPHFSFHPHGLHVLAPQGEKPEPDELGYVRARDIHLFVVNHRSDGDVVSIFTQSENDQSVATHVASVQHSLLVNLEDVVGVSPTEFFATRKGYYPIGSTASGLELFTRQAWGDVIHCLTTHNSWDCRRMETSLSIPNGLALSKDGQNLFVVETGKKALVWYNVTRVAGGSRQRVFLDELDRIGLGSFCENVNLAQDTGDLYLGCHPSSLSLMSHMTDGDSASPAQILKVNTNKLNSRKTPEVTEVYASVRTAKRDTEHLSAISSVDCIECASQTPRFFAGAMFDEGILIFKPDFQQLRPRK